MHNYVKYVSMHLEIFSSVRRISVLVYRSRRYIKTSITSRCQTPHLNCTGIALISYGSAFRSVVISSAQLFHAYAPAQTRVTRVIGKPPLPPSTPLTTLRANLHRRSLRALFALNPARLSLRRVRRALRLLRLLGALGR